MTERAVPPSSPTASVRGPVTALGAWTAFLWLTRIKNAVGDDDISRGGRAVAVVTSVLFLVAATTVVAAAWRRSPHATRLAGAFAVVSIGYWVVRAVTIVVRDHPLGFTVVHVVLAAVTVALSGLVLRARRAPRGITPSRAGSSPAATAG